MDKITLRKEYVKHFEYLEALAFFVQDLNPTLKGNIAHSRENYESFSFQTLDRLLKAIKRDIENVRELNGAIADNDFYRRLFAQARADSARGYTYISKLNIEKLMFKKYEHVFPRWPHIKYHAFVIFDAKDDSARGQIYQLDSVLWDDILLMLEHCRKVHGGEKDFRKRGMDQKTLQSYLRSTTTAIFTFLEAYLNGIAYDCFQLHHDDLEIKDHDLLGEWDSENKREKFVPFAQKVFKYPRIIAKQNGLTFDMSHLHCAQQIVQDGKAVRDSIMHPSPKFDTRDPEPLKATALMRINLPAVESLVKATKGYVEAVEKGIGEDPAKSVQYLFR